MDISPRKPCKRLTEPVDDWLHSEGFFRKHAPRDPTCLFRAISEQVYLTQFFHIRVRQECIKFMLANQRLFEENISIPFDSYMEQMSFFTEWGSIHEIKAMSLLYQREIFIFNAETLTRDAATRNGFEKIIYLCHIPPKHYESVYPKDFITTAAFCQSIIYQTLYKDVFNMTDVDDTVFEMLHDRASTVSHDKFFLKQNLDIRDQLRVELYDKVNKDREECKVSQAIAKGITPFPYRVAKALDPNIYRNTDFDIWHEIRREIRNAGWMRYNSSELQVGGKCLVQMEMKEDELDNVNNNFMRTNNTGQKFAKDKNGNDQKIQNKTGKNDPVIFSGHIQEMSKNEGPVVVFIEELGEKKTVPYASLKPLTPRKPKQMNWPHPHKKNNISDTNNHTGQKWKKSWCSNTRKSKDMTMNVNMITKNHTDTNNNKGEIDETEHWENESRLSEDSNLSYKTYTMNRLTAYQGYPINTSVDVMPVSIDLETSVAGLVEPLVDSLQQETIQSNDNHGCNTLRMAYKAMPSSETTDKNTSVQTEVISHGPPNNRNVPNDVYYPAQTEVPQYLANNGLYYGPPDCNMPMPPQYFMNNGITYSSNAMDSPVHTTSQVNHVMQAINFSAPKSVETNGSDLPLSDIVTVRFFYNLGVDYFRATNGWVGCGTGQPLPIGNCYIPPGSLYSQYTNPAINNSMGNETVRSNEDESYRNCPSISQHVAMSRQREQASSPRDRTPNTGKGQNKSNANCNGLQKSTVKNDFQNTADNGNSAHAILLQQSTLYSPANDKLKEQNISNKDNQRSTRNSIAPRFKKNFDGRCRNTRQQQYQQPQHQQNSSPAESESSKNARAQNSQGNGGRAVLQSLPANPGCGSLYPSPTVPFSQQAIFTAVPYYPPDAESVFQNPYFPPNQNYPVPYIPHTDITDGNNINHYPPHIYPAPESFGQPYPVFPQYMYPPGMYPTIPAQSHPENWYGVPGQTQPMGAPQYVQYSPPPSSMPMSPSVTQNSNVSK